MKIQSSIPSCAALLLLLALPLLGATDEGYRRTIKAETLLKTSTDAAGRPLEFPHAGAEFTTVLVEIPAGQDTGWHVHPNACVAYVLEGKVTVETAGGTVRAFKAGDCFAEVVNLAHCGRNMGKEPVKILLVVAGERGAPISRPVAK